MKSKKLKRELLQAGAKPPEVDELDIVASKLKLLKNHDDRRQSWARVLKPVAIALPALFIGAAIVMYSQSSSPTSWLYPVQKLSDSLAIKASPNYRATVMMHRAQQVNQLVADNAPSQIILATLTSYDSEASSYRAMPHANYAAFEYRKSNFLESKRIAMHPLTLSRLSQIV